MAPTDSRIRCGRIERSGAWDRPISRCRGGGGTDRGTAHTARLGAGTDAACGHHKLEGLGDIAGVLERANPKERAKVYADLGVTLIYRPDVGLVDVQAVPVAACAYERVGGGITPIRTRVLRGVIDLKAA